MRQSRHVNDAKPFETRCQKLFSVRLGYGRKWKTACAQALGIGRATLYRYFEAETVIPDDVTRQLLELEKPQKPVRNDREMVILYASGLVELQKRIDERGCLTAPYPRSLQRAFDLGAANNILSGTSNWPTDLITLSRSAQEPLFRWVQDMSWDSHDEFFASRLIENGEVGTDCLRLAINDGDPEREIEENFGYDMFVGICRNREDGDELYRTWRRLVVENPVLQNWSSTILVKNPLLAGVNRIDEIVEAFCQCRNKTPAVLPVLTTAPTSFLPSRHTTTPASQRRLRRLWRDSSDFATRQAFRTNSYPPAHSTGT
jgi:hypothetical protein